MNRLLSHFFFFIAVSWAPLASAEELVFSPEVQCDFDVTDSYFLLMYDSGRLAVIPTLTAPVRGRGDKALVGGATWIVGGTIPASTETPPQSEKLTMVRAVLRGAEDRIKVVPIPVPVAEDLHPLSAAEREISTLVKSRAEELEKAEGKIVQAQAELERMRSGEEESPTPNQPPAEEESFAQRERVLAQNRRTIQSLEARYEKLKLKGQYPFDAIIQSTYEQAADRFRTEIIALDRRNRSKSDSGALSPEERERLMQLGRSADPVVLKERLALIRAKTRAFEERLQNLGVDTEPHPQEFSPPVRHQHMESVLPVEEESDE